MSLGELLRAVLAGGFVTLAVGIVLMVWDAARQPRGAHAAPRPGRGERVTLDPGRFGSMDLQAEREMLGERPPGWWLTWPDPPPVPLEPGDVPPPGSWVDRLFADVADPPPGLLEPGTLGDPPPLELAHAEDWEAAQGAPPAFTLELLAPVEIPAAVMYPLRPEWRAQLAAQDQDAALYLATMRADWAALRARYARAA